MISISELRDLLCLEDSTLRVAIENLLQHEQQEETEIAKAVTKCDHSEINAFSCDRCGADWE